MADIDFHEGPFFKMMKRGGVICCDSFSRTALGSTDGIPWLPGQNAKAWTQQSGTIVISSGDLKASVAGIATIDPLPAADSFRTWFQIVGATSGNNNRFAFRYTDTSTYVALAMTSSSIQFGTVSGGTLSGIGTGSTGVSPAAGDTIAVVINGNAFTGSVIRAGVQVGTSATVSSNSTLAGTTPLGFRFADTTFSICNLIITRL